VYWALVFCLLPFRPAFRIGFNLQRGQNLGKLTPAKA